MIILGLETSCDDTAAAVVSDGITLGETVSTQLEHQRFGGVVPEIASRAHLRNILPVLNSTLKGAGLTLEDIEAAAVTYGPGLAGALLVGLNFARGISDAYEIPIIAVNHLRAHAWAAEIDHTPIPLPFIALLVSGGHTSLALVEGVDRYETLGQTLDDSAGEALDKIGRLMGLPYPSGAEIERIAREGNPEAYDLPRGMSKSGDLNFSFSGLKTAAKLFLERNPQCLEGAEKADFLASFQEAALDILAQKSLEAVKATGVNRLALGGGVAANSRLKSLLRREGLELYSPSPSRCTDNAVMVAFLGEKLFKEGKTVDARAVSAEPNLTVDSG